MKKSCMFSIILYVILVNVFHLQARDENQPQAYFSAWPTHQSNPVAHVEAYTQINRVEKDPFDLITPQNSGFKSSSSSQDWYQQHRQFILSNVVGISLQGKTIKITPEDVNLINRICADNPHKDQNELRMQLAQSSAFNYAQHFLKGDRELQAFTSDIYINPDHFKAVSENKYRINKLEKAAKDAVEDWYKQEKSKLNSKSKTKSQDAKKLKEEYQGRKQYPLGNKQDIQILINDAKKFSASNALVPVTKKSNITPQEIQKLRESNDNQSLKLSRDQDSSFQQVMDKRSKAFESSINNPTPTTEHFKVNSQTTAFLQAQGIDTIQFQQVEGLSIQHQLTHELVDVLDAVAEYAGQHYYEIYQTHLTKYCAHLASLSQQSNLEGALEQAIDGTNCCHGIEHYLKGMVSGVAQAYQQFQTALDYFDAVADTYGNLIVQHAAQGAMVANGLEAIVTVGMITAPTVTIAATGVMIGATAYVMAPVCFQALMELKDFGFACIVGDWSKIGTDLDKFGTFISKPETVVRMAELAGGTVMPTPNLSCVVEHILSLRPVITSVQNASGEITRSFSLMTKKLRERVYEQGLELVQQLEFINFNMIYEKICGFHFFNILPKSHPALAGMESGLLSSGEQASLTSLFAQAEGSVAGNVITSGASSIGSQAAQGLLPKDFAVTEVGKKMLQTITKPYEKVMFENITKDYGKLIANQAPQETISIFCRCHDLSIVPQKISNDIERLHEMFKNKYLGLQEFSSENSYLTMQMRHIFYPNLQPKFNEDCQFIKEFKLNGFHHDEYSVLEKSGSVQWKNKIHGKAEFGAEECFMADSDWGDGIICQAKTFFPSAWSREKTVQVIFEAAQNKIEDISEPHQKNQKKYLCKGPNNMLIEMVINSKNIIISAYPSKKNFRI